jgi:hypothetical protein
MSHPLVVHVMRSEYDVYVGRWNPKVPHHSIWHNPFLNGSREENIENFKNYLLSSPELMAKLPELRGKRLACWCSPKECHADVLATLANE